MRNLTAEEIEQVLDDSGEKEEGAIAIEATVQELADLGTSTTCGNFGNKTFKALADKGYGHRKCRGWFSEKPRTQSIEIVKKMGLSDSELQERIKNISEIMNDKPVVMGMFHIKIQTDKTAEKVERITEKAGGSLRFDGDSKWEGFKEFEIE